MMVAKPIEGSSAAPEAMPVDEMVEILSARRCELDVQSVTKSTSWGGADNAAAVT